MACLQSGGTIAIPAAKRSSEFAVAVSSDGLRDGLDCGLRGRLLPLRRPARLYAVHLARAAHDKPMPCGVQVSFERARRLVLNWKVDR